MQLFRQAIDLFLHLDKHLTIWTQTLGHSIYLVLFAIVFCETGLVVTPFLPGDSLLFAAGALAALSGSPLNVQLLAFILLVAAVSGDAVNYAIGLRVGPRVFQRETSRLLNKKHLLSAQAFYERHGGKAIVLARFVPIVRTFAPFVAGIGQMRYRRFAAFNVLGAVLWVCAFVGAGYWFGNLSAVRRNFQFVILAIIVLSVMPAVIEFVREKRRAQDVIAGAET